MNLPPARRAGARLDWGHTIQRLRRREQAVQNPVGYLFRKSSGKFAADLVDNGRRAGNEILQQRLRVRAVANFFRSAIEVAQLYAMGQIVPVVPE